MKINLYSRISRNNISALKVFLVLFFIAIFILPLLIIEAGDGGFEVYAGDREERKNVLDFVYQEIKDGYLNLDFKEEHLDFDFQQKYLQAGRELTEDITAAEEFKILGNFVHNLQDGHLRLRPIDDQWSELFRSHNYQGLLDIRWIEDRPIIIAAPEELNLTGRELLKFNGLDFTDLIADTIKTWGGGGNTAQARDRVLIKEHYYSQYQLKKGELPGKLLLTVRDEEGKREVLWQEPDSQRTISRESILKLNQEPSGSDESLEFSYDKNFAAGIMRINDFQIHPVEMQNRLESWLNELQERDEIRGIILDLRYNKGGNESFRRLLEYLIEESIVVGHYRYRYSEKFLRFHPERVLGDITAGRRSPRPAGEGYSGYWHWKITPVEESFLREVPVVVLANSATFSAGDIFVRMVLTHELGKVMGSKLVFSGQGLTEYTELPCGRYRLGFGLQELRDENYQVVENKTALPDRKVRLKLEEVRAGRDNQLQAALEYLKKIRTNAD